MSHETQSGPSRLSPAVDSDQGGASVAADRAAGAGAVSRAQLTLLTPADPLLVYYEAAWVALSDLEDAVKARLFLTVDGRSGCYLGATAELVQTIRQAVEVIKGDVERGGVPVTGSPERPWEVSARRVLAEQEGE